MSRLIIQNDVPSGTIPLMLYLLDNPNSSIQDMEQVSGLSNNVVSKRMRTLFQRGYVTRRDAAHHSREYRLTKKGEDVAKGLHWIMVVEDREEEE